MAEILNKATIAKINHETKRARTMKVYDNHGKSCMKSINGPHEIRNINGRPIRLSLSKSTRDTTDLPTGGGASSPETTLTGNPVKDASGFYTVTLTATNAVGSDVALGMVQIVEEENNFIFLPTILTGMIPRE